MRPPVPIPQVQSDLQVGYEDGVAEQTFQQGSVFGRSVHVFEQCRSLAAGRRFCERNVVRACRPAVRFRLQRDEAPVAGLGCVEVLHGHDARCGIRHDHILQLFAQHRGDRPLVGVWDVDDPGEHTVHRGGKRGVGHDGLHALPIPLVPLFEVVERLQARTHFRARILRRGQFRFGAFGVGRECP